MTLNKHAFDMEGLITYHFGVKIKWIWYKKSLVIVLWFIGKMTSILTSKDLDAFGKS